MSDAQVPATDPDVARELGLTPGAGGPPVDILNRLEVGLVRLAERQDASKAILEASITAARRESASANQLLQAILERRMDSDHAALLQLRAEFDSFKASVEREWATTAQEEREQEHERGARRFSLLQVVVSALLSLVVGAVLWVATTQLHH